MQNPGNDTAFVCDSYKLSDGRIIAFLKYNKGKLLPLMLLEDEAGKEWTVQQYLRTTNSPEGYEKIRAEEEQGIFQYLLLGRNQEDKPAKGSWLKINNESGPAL